MTRIHRPLLHGGLSSSETHRTREGQNPKLVDLATEKAPATLEPSSSSVQKISECGNAQPTLSALRDKDGDQSGVSMRPGRTTGVTGVSSDRSQLTALGNGVAQLLLAASKAHAAGDEQRGQALDTLLTAGLCEYLRLDGSRQETSSPEGRQRNWLIGGYLGTGNDIFYKPFDRFGDDQRFTASLLGGLVAKLGKHKISVDMLYQMLTEPPAPGRTANECSRWDQVVANFKYDRRIEHGATTLCFGPRVGFVFDGDANGAKFQHWCHNESGMMTGPGLYDPDPDKRLQSTYEGESHFGWTVGAKGTVDVDLVRLLCGPQSRLPRLTSGLGAELQVAPGKAGVSFVCLSQSNRLDFVIGAFRPYLSYSLNLQHFATNDPELAKPYYYRVGGFSSGSTLEAGLCVGNVSVALAIDTNKGGSGQGVGELKIGFRL